MNLESFLAELRAAREAGVVFVLDRDMIRVHVPETGESRCPLEVVCDRVARRTAPYYAVPYLIDMNRHLASDLVWAADGRSEAPPTLRAKLLEACGLVPEETKP